MGGDADSVAPDEGAGTLYFSGMGGGGGGGMLKVGRGIRRIPWAGFVGKPLDDNDDDDDVVE